VYSPANLAHLHEKIKHNGDLINLVVSDGGFEIKKNDKGEHMENYQELYSSRIILSEILVMIQNLQPGGNPTPLFLNQMRDTYLNINCRPLRVQGF